MNLRMDNQKNSSFVKVRVWADLKSKSGLCPLTFDDWLLDKLRWPWVWLPNALDGATPWKTFATIAPNRRSFIRLLNSKCIIFVSLQRARNNDKELF